MRSLLLVVLLLFLSITAHGQNYSHIKTFGFDYGGGTTPTAELQWLATHHDAVIGMVDYALEPDRINETQYDIMKAANPNVKLFAYMYHTAFTTTDYETFARDWATDNSLDPEDLYIHYYYDNPVKIRVSVTRTSGTGTPSDRICTSAGTLVDVGTAGTYYLSLGYGGGTATTLAEARVYQKWNAGWEPKANHLHSTYYGAYKAWVLYQSQLATGKTLDGIMLDTYEGPVLDEYNPNMHQLIELRNAGYSTDHTAARNYYAVEMAEMIGTLKSDLRSTLGDSDFVVTFNGAELSYIYNITKFATGDQFGTGKLESATLEYLTSPSKTTYWIVDGYFDDFLNDLDAKKLETVFAQSDLAWWDYGAYPKPPIGGKQHIIGSFYLFNEPEVYFGVHYGGAGNYSRRDETGAYETAGSSYSISHWDKMLEYDIGSPVIHSGTDFQGHTNTDKMYVVEKVVGTRYVMARDYSNGKVLVRYESSDNNTASDLGTDPLIYNLGGTYKRLLEDGSLGSEVTTITLGKSEGAIMIRAIQSRGTVPLGNMQ